MASLITAIGISKRYGSKATEITALDDVSFAIEAGSLTIVYGPSGAGKTTLLNILGGMDTPSAGVLAIDGENTAAYNSKQRTHFRRNKVGFVFQFYNLMPDLTAKENVLFATELRGKESIDAEQALISVGLGHRLDNYPSQLSGGEQQRVCIARALAKNAPIILCDEPTGALDYQTGKDILSLLSKAAKQGKAVLIVTHNSAIKDMGDHIIHIKNGKIVSDTHNPNPKDIKDIEW